MSNRRDTSCHIAGSSRPVSFEDALRSAAGPLRTAFSDLLVRIADNHPARIIGNADAADLEERAVHIETLLQDVTAYVAAVWSDTKDSTHVAIDARILNCLSDASSDLVGTLRNAADDLKGIAR